MSAAIRVVNSGERTQVVDRAVTGVRKAEGLAR